MIIHPSSRPRMRRPRSPLLGTERADVLKPAPEVRRFWDVRLTKLLVEFDISCGWREAFHIGMVPQKGLNIILNLEAGELCRTLLAHLQRIFLLQLRSGGSLCGGSPSLVSRGLCGGSPSLVSRGAGRGTGRGTCSRGDGSPCWHATLEGLELSQCLRGGHALTLELSHELRHREAPQRPLEIALADVHAERLHLLLTDDYDVVPLSQLSSAHLLVQSVAAGIGLGIVAIEHKLPLHPSGIIEELLTNRHHHDLSRREPEGPLPSVMLDQDRRHPLNGTKDGTVDDDWPLEALLELALPPNHLALVILLHFANELRLIILLLSTLLTSFATELQIEPDRIVEIKLDRPTLKLPLHGILQPDVNFGAIEGAIAWVQGPLDAGLVQCGFQLRFRVIPDLLGAQGLLWARGERIAGSEAEHRVDVIQEIEGACHL
mmetsp:Transcript_87591/g.194821  ORF Transcript_87591/g.194821 Transcript_87591/m.194821 type:complete len:432 (-) Transcript_87591:1520-2815(-)